MMLTDPASWGGTHADSVETLVSDACTLFVACDSDSGEVTAEKEKVPMVFAEIRPDEIPDVPFQKFLYRGKQEQEEVTPAGDAK